MFRRRPSPPPPPDATRRAPSAWRSTTTPSRRVDISPPFGDSPDRVPLRPHDQRNIIDPVGAYVFPAPKSGPPLSPAACDRTLPIFDGYTRFDLKLSYVGEKQVQGEGLQRPGRRLRGALRADRRAPQGAAGDQVHGGEQGHSDLAGAGRRRCRARAVSACRSRPWSARSTSRRRSFRSANKRQSGAERVLQLLLCSCANAPPRPCAGRARKAPGACSRRGGGRGGRRLAPRAVGLRASLPPIARVLSRWRRRRRATCPRAPAAPFSARLLASVRRRLRALRRALPVGGAGFAERDGDGLTAVLHLAALAAGAALQFAMLELMHHAPDDALLSRRFRHVGSPPQGCEEENSQSRQ